MPRKGKCFSTCRKMSKTECDHPMCRYTDGRQYKYCRLNNAYKMNASCEPELRERKGKSKRKLPTKKLQSLNKTIEKIQLLDDMVLTPINSPKELNKSPPKVDTVELKEPPVKVSEEEIREFRERVKKANATRKIKKFMKKHQNKRRAHFLKAICSDADVCMAFGTESEKIKKHFHNFQRFGMLSKPAKTIGAVSANGFVKELTYESDGYVANAILKSSSNVNGDNLLYEGLVGMFLNGVGKILPSFLETYGIYGYISKYAQNKMKTEKETDKDLLQAALQKIETIEKEHLSRACTESLLMAVLIQHLNDVETIGDKLSKSPKSSEFLEFVSEELLYVLFQVYFSLFALGHFFTHYDLHTDNVLLYEPVKGKYIEYHYHVQDDTTGKEIDVRFKSRYIAKIIDYGRSYFEDPSGKGFTANSKSIYDEVCKETKCKDCGNSQGFGWLEYKPATLPYNAFICSQIPNESHDLRLAYMIRKYAKLTGTLWDSSGLYLLHFFEKIEYGKGVILNKDRKDILAKNPNAPVFAGTKENDDIGLPLKINNVTDASKELQRIAMDSFSQACNEQHYAGLQKLGDLHIYGYKPMEYIPA